MVTVKARSMFRGGQAVAKGGVIDPVALLGFDAGQAHQAGGVALAGQKQLLGPVGIGHIGHADADGGHHQRQDKAQAEKAHRKRAVPARFLFTHRFGK